MEDHRDSSRVPLEKLVAQVIGMSRHVDDLRGVNKVDYLLSMAPHY
jgi:hypothetical protein